MTFSCYRKTPHTSNYVIASSRVPAALYMTLIASSDSPAATNVQYAPLDSRECFIPVADETPDLPNLAHIATTITPEPQMSYQMALTGGPSIITSITH